MSFSMETEKENKLSFLDKYFKKFLNNVHVVKENVPTVKKKRLLLVLPYLGLNYNKH